MKTQAALLWEQPGEWQVREVDLDEPQTGEVLVEMAAAGLCHTDDHMSHGLSRVGMVPICGGHEGSGIVRAVGPGVRELAVGDHILTSFIPSCGVCRWCASGMQQLCDNGAVIMSGAQLDKSFRMHTDGQDVGSVGILGTFAQWAVLSELSCVKIGKDVPLDVACLVSCGVPTGWGSSANVAGIEVGDVVIVMGCGGIGMNAVQGAAHKGAAHVVAVDPQPFKREMALKLGATETFADIDEAMPFVRSVTNGQGADSAVVATGVLTGEHVASAFRGVRKAGTVVVTGVSHTENVPIDLYELSMFSKRLQGCLYGNASPRKQIPLLLNLYREGILKLDELITRRYPLEQINQGFADMHAGINIRGIIDFSVRD